MEESIKQAFLHVDVIGPHVHEGHYDLVGMDGEVILPQVWETTIQPDWALTMHMWPMPEPAKGELQSTPPLPPDLKMFQSSQLPMRSQRSRNWQPSVDAGSKNQTILEALQTLKHPSRTGTSAMNTSHRLSPDIDHGSTQSGSQTSGTSISDEDVVEE